MPRKKNLAEGKDHDDGNHSDDRAGQDKLIGHALGRILNRREREHQGLLLGIGQHGGRMKSNHAPMLNESSLPP